MPVDNDAITFEKYCDHCPGWIKPLIEKAGFFCVYDMIDRKIPRCREYIYADKLKAEAKQKELEATSALLG